MKYYSALVLSVVAILAACGEESKYYLEAPEPEVNYVKESMTDSRDGHVYKTVEIGTQVWMAENLNYEISGSYCYDDNPVNCDTYGRIYVWSAAMNACPAGWHLPSREEFETLIEFVGGESKAGQYLKSRSGWKSAMGSDDYGFAALPGGDRALDGAYYFEREEANFMSSSGNICDNGVYYFGECETNAYYMILIHNSTRARINYSDKEIGYSVRCVKN